MLGTAAREVNFCQGRAKHFMRKSLPARAASVCVASADMSSNQHPRQWSGGLLCQKQSFRRAEGFPSRGFEIKPTIITPVSVPTGQMIISLIRVPRGINVCESVCLLVLEKWIKRHLKVQYGILFFGHFCKINWNPIHNKLNSHWVGSIEIKQVNHLWSGRDSKNASHLLTTWRHWTVYLSIKRTPSPLMIIRLDAAPLA